MSHPTTHLEQSLMHALTPSASRSGHRHARGFTLIELMITVAIVAILTGIAYPSYRNYVVRSQVVNATTGLSTMQANMERYFQDNRQYTQVSAALPNPCANPVTLGNFTINCQSVTAAAGATPAGFVLQAVGTANVNGFTYTIDNFGTQTSAVASPAPSAWILTCAASWELKAGQC